MKRTITTALALTLTLLAAGAVQASNDSSDALTTLKVKIQLLTKLGIDARSIDVDTEGGVVSLSGTVDKRETQELAGEVAGTVKGVASVDNDIQLEASLRTGKTVDSALTEAEAEVKDALLENRVQLALADRLGSDGFRIDTEAASGVVTLAFEKSMAKTRRQEAVKIAEGVTGVDRVISIEKS
jgi:osmotically-inducible protein OsmY